MISTLEKSFAVYASTPSEKAQWVGHIEKCVEELIRNGLPDAMRSDKASRLCNPCHEDKNGERGPDLQPKSKYRFNQSWFPSVQNSQTQFSLFTFSDEDNIGEEDMKTESTAVKKEAPPRPPPPKLFPDGDKPYQGDAPLSGMP